MCNEDWSSAWVELSNKHGWNEDTKYKIEPINRDLAQKLLDNIDLSNLQTLWLKGGEPFLNKEVILVLEKLKQLNQLRNVHIMVTTNCTVINEPILELLEQAKNITFVCSIDGINDLNTWIRFAPNTQYTSDIDNITRTLKRFAKLKNLDHLSLSCAVSVYNIFNLKDLKSWWEGSIIPLYNYKNQERFVSFNHFVVRPDDQCARVLTQPTIDSLIDYYSSNNERNAYTAIIEYLKKGYLGDKIHNNWVYRTRTLDSVRPKKLIDIVPQLKDELVIIQPKQ
jgi:sulfatase maturation enzyme AslB (radical SAM superfamily)